MGHIEMAVLCGTFSIVLPFIAVFLMHLLMATHPRVIFGDAIEILRERWRFMLGSIAAMSCFYWAIIKWGTPNGLG